MAGGHVLLVVGAVIVAIILGFSAIGWGIQALDKPARWLIPLAAI